MADISNQLRADLRQCEFSEGYAESFLDTYVATQLKVLREQNGWTQARLAQEMGKKQTVISRAENVNYSSWNVSTLKEYARAFRLRLRVSFETYGSLIDDIANFNRKALERTPRESDPSLEPEAAQSEVRDSTNAGTVTLDDVIGEHQVNETNSNAASTSRKGVVSTSGVPIPDFKPSRVISIETLQGWNPARAQLTDEQAVGSIKMPPRSETIETTSRSTQTNAR